MTSAPDTGRTAEEMWAQIRKAIKDRWDLLTGPALDNAAIAGVPGAWRRKDLCDQFVDALLSGPLAPILQEAAHLRAENANLRDRVREAEGAAEAMRERCAREAERVVKVPAKTIGGMRIERLPMAPRTPREIAAGIRALSLTAQHEEAADA